MKIMNQFNFNRFVNVARWDLTVNSKFYTRSILVCVIAVCLPVVMSYLLALIRGHFIHVYDNIEKFSLISSVIGTFYMVIAFGYMFHNLLTKQGRINELTLPSTNLERFLWHFLVIWLGTQIVWFVSVAMADLLHVIFRAMLHATDYRSIFADCFAKSIPWVTSDTYGHDLVPLSILMAFNGVSTFSLVNAWKYKYNIPLTILFHFLFWIGTLIVSAIIVNLFVAPDFLLQFIKWLNEMNPTTVLVLAYIFAAMLFCGIWFLTYRLYTRAQLTTQRNP